MAKQIDLDIADKVTLVLPGRCVALLVDTLNKMAGTFDDILDIQEQLEEYGKRKKEEAEKVKIESAKTEFARLDARKTELVEQLKAAGVEIGKTDGKPSSSAS